MHFCAALANWQLEAVVRFWVFVPSKSEGLRRTLDSKMCCFLLVEPNP